MTPKNQIEISNQTARRFLLDHQRLLKPRKKKGKKAVLEIFNHLKSIQFDTINVVGRNADLVLQSRVKDYIPKLLEELLYSDRKLFDGWDKQASIYRIEDRPFFEPFRKRMLNKPDKRYENVKAYIPEIKKRLEKEGPLSSLDFKGGKKIDWHWSETSVGRATLEFMWYTGQVGVHHRINTRRVFDLVEKLVPLDILNQEYPFKADGEYQEWHIHRRIGSKGIASLRSGEIWSGIVGVKAPERKRAINKLLEDRKIIEVLVENHDKEPLYIRAEDLETLKSASKSKLRAKSTSFIAPLDNLIWNRRLIKELFGFEYVWEVYKPKVKRKYGYYVLPVLFGDKFIARLDSKFDRKTQILTVNNWWWEDGISPDEEMHLSISNCFKEFMNYLGTENIKFEKTIKFRNKLLL